MRIIALTLIALAMLIDPAAAQPAQTTIATTAPVITTIDGGSLIGQAATWVATVFGGALAAVLTAWLARLFKLAGIQTTDAMRARLDELAVNGINLAAKTLATRTEGRLRIDIKNDVVAEAVKYVQAHGADTLKALGVDPTSPKAIEAIKARIETAIADPAVPTPAILAAQPTATATPPQGH